MKIRILGGGWYGCHLALALLEDGHEVELHELGDRLFSGASGGNPARLHLGFHYPRSKLTRAMCQDHRAQFMARYGDLTHGVPVNLYAVAAHDSLVDFGTYKQVLRGDVEFVEVDRPEEFGLAHVEGALLTGERHVVIHQARLHFEKALGACVVYSCPPGGAPRHEFDLTIDCTFCSLDSENIDRFEPCIMGLLRGPTDRAVTIMDGPFPSLYPWDEAEGLSSLTSARFTPITRAATYAAAKMVLGDMTANMVGERLAWMFGQLCGFWPEARALYSVVGHRLSIRAMPKSAADARLVDVVRTGDKALRVRAGKIDAVFHAERVVKDFIRDGARTMKHLQVA